MNHGHGKVTRPYNRTRNDGSLQTDPVAYTNIFYLLGLYYCLSSDTHPSSRHPFMNPINNNNLLFQKEIMGTIASPLRRPPLLLFCMFNELVVWSVRSLPLALL